MVKVVISVADIVARMQDPPPRPPITHALSRTGNRRCGEPDPRHAVSDDTTKVTCATCLNLLGLRMPKRRRHPKWKFDPSEVREEPMRAHVASGGEAHTERAARKLKVHGLNGQDKATCGVNLRLAGDTPKTDDWNRVTCKTCLAIKGWREPKHRKPKRSK